jgi:hypothetical protein
MNRLNHYVNAWLPARNLVRDALLKRFDVDSSGKIVVFNEFFPWKVCHVISRSLKSHSRSFCDIDRSTCLNWRQ